jgi:hypothetical protein
MDLPLLTQQLSTNAFGEPVNPATGLTMLEEQSLREQIGLPPISRGSPAIIPEPKGIPGSKGVPGLPGVPGRNEAISENPGVPGLPGTGGFNDPPPLAAPPPAPMSMGPPATIAVPAPVPSAGGAPPENEPVPVAPSTPAAPKAQRGGGGGGAFAGAEDAVQKLTEARIAEERAAVAGLEERGRLLKDYEAQEREAQQKEAAQLQAMTGRVEDAQKALTAPEAKIDPNRFWKNAGTGTKIAQALAIALGAFSQVASGLGSDPRRPTRNIGVDMLNRAIDQDIQLQMDERSAGREQKRNQLQGSLTLLQLAQGAVKDSQAQRLLARSMGLEVAANQAQLFLSGTKEQTAKASGAQMIADLRIKAQESRQAAQQREHSNWVQGEHLRLQERQLGAQMANQQLEREAKAREADMKARGLDDVTIRMLHTVDQGVNGIRARLQEARDLIEGRGIKQPDGSYKKVAGAFGSESGGTGEAQGPFNAILEANIQAAAEERAKVFDPQSTNREAEVQNGRKVLPSIGSAPLINDTQETALAKIEAALRVAEAKRREWYRQYGLVSDSDPQSVKSFTAGK